MNLVFRSYDDLDAAAPVRAANAVPEWFRHLQPHPNGKDAPPSARMCGPFEDALRAGYLLTLPFDLTVDYQDGQPNFACAEAWANVQTHHPAQLPGFGRLFKFVSGWAAAVPEGWSLLYTHPLNRHDLPFRAFSGLVDGGYDAAVNIPFTWHGDVAALAAGTPIASLIPVSPESCAASYERVPTREMEHAARLVQMIPHAYRRRFRRDKEDTWA